MVDIQEIRTFLRSILQNAIDGLPDSAISQKFRTVYDREIPMEDFGFETLHDFFTSQYFSKFIR